MGDRTDDLLAAVLAEARERSERGEAVSVEDLCREHPDLADALRAALDAQTAFRRAGREPAAGTLRPLPRERYQGFRRAGEGGMGIVYWAIDTDLNREVAFKVVRPGDEAATKDADPLSLSPPDKDTPASRAFQTLKARFLQEAWVTGGLNHPGIVPVYELGQTPEGIPYYTMRFVRGERTLALAIRDAAGKPIEDRLALLEPLLKVCDTIRYAHAQGVVHRDLKPANIALGDFGEVVVLDWGLAKLRGRSEVAAEERWQAHLRLWREAADLKTATGILGTPGYMSPEAALGRSELIDERSDVYSLGAILFEILTGRLPFDAATYGAMLLALRTESAPSPSALDPRVPDDLSALCRKALARDPAERPASVGTLADGLRAWQAQRARERAVADATRRVEAALEAAADTTGAARARALDRAVAALDQAAELGADAKRLLPLRRRAGALREAGVRERERAAGRTAFRRAGVLALLLAAVGGSIAAGVFDASRRAAEEARGVASREEAEARRQTAAAQANLADAYIHLSRSMRAEGRVDAARVAAAHALAVRETQAGWSAFMDAEQGLAMPGRWLAPPEGIAGWVLAVVPTRSGAWIVEGEGGVQWLDLEGHGSSERWASGAGSDGFRDVFADTGRGDSIYAGREDGVVLLEPGITPDRLLMATPSPVTALAVVGHGRWLVAALARGGLVGFDLAARKPVGTIDPDAGEVYDLEWSGFDHALYGSGGPELVAWDVPRDADTLALRRRPARPKIAEPVRQIRFGGGLRPRGVAVSRDGRRLFVWDVGGEVAREVVWPSGLEDVQWSHDRQRLFVVTAGGGLVLVDPDTGERISVFVPETRRRMGRTHLAIAMDRILALIRDDDGTTLRLREWSARWMREGPLVRESSLHWPATDAIAVSPQGRFVAWSGSGSRGKVVRVWDPGDAAQYRLLETTTQPSSIALADGSDRVWVGDWEGRIRMWDAREGVTTAPSQPAATVGAHTGRVRELHLSADETRLYSVGDEDGLVKTWDAVTLAPVESIAPAPTSVLSITPPSAAGEFVALVAKVVRRQDSSGTSTATISEPRLLRWRGGDGWTPFGPTDVGVGPLVGARDRPLVVAVGADAAPMLLDGEGRLVRRFEKPVARSDQVVDAPDALALSPPHATHQVLVGTASIWRTLEQAPRLRLWDLETGRLLRDLPTPHVDEIGGVVFGAMEEIYTLGDEGARSWQIEPILMGHEDRIAYLRRAYGLEAEGFDLRPTPAAPAGR